MVRRFLIMLPIISALLAFVAGLFRSRASLCLEHLALRHQLAVYQQTVHRPRLRPTDRLFWAWLSRLWSAWHDALVFVQPRTVIAWQQQRFRDHWRRLSQQGTPGRPADGQGDPRSSSRTCGRPIRPGVHPGSSGNCTSWASTWPNRPWRSIASDAASRHHRRGRPFSTTT